VVRWCYLVLRKVIIGQNDFGVTRVNVDYRAIDVCFTSNLLIFMYLFCFEEVIIIFVKSEGYVSSWCYFEQSRVLFSAYC
jgi:hypothetical protein